MIRNGKLGRSNSWPTYYILSENTFGRTISNNTVNGYLSQSWNYNTVGCDA